MKFIGLSYDGLRDILKANTHSGKTKEMLWNEKIEEFMVGVKVPYQSDRIRSLDYRNGRKYLGLLMSEVWKREEVEMEGSAVMVPEMDALSEECGISNPGSALSRVPGSLREEVWKFSDKVNVSSYAF